MDPLSGLRLGSVPYLNAAPLVHGLPAVRTAVPSRLARWLEDGTCDLAAALSLGAVLYRPDWRVLPSCGVASDGPVRTVMILHEGNLESQRGLSLDPASRTSNLLARWILKRVSGTDPWIGPGAKARVLIGDAAFAHDPSEGSDMGETWKALTGLPFVFAGWVAGGALARDGARLREIDAFLAERTAEDPVRLEEIALSQTAVAPRVARIYLTDNIRHNLDARFRSGADLFAAELAGLGEGTGAIPWAC
ncbi:MAG TPA: MqnA/MqnD/SBP family protein [Fibrobacteria bacterium]|nr:MqnA/MqnD/SBP family protein [Fibrobacteria bacterium]